MKASAHAAEEKRMDEIDLMRERYRRGREHCQKLYDEARRDIRFVTVPGNHWDETLRARRRNRPMYEFPKLRTHCLQIINEQKQTRPQGKVRGVGDNDQGLAEIMQGLCRNIESVSNADQAYDIAFEPAVQGGFGAWRICADWAEDSMFQELRIEPIPNPFAVTFDPAATKIDRRDGNWIFVEELMPLQDYERKYPDADITGFESDQDKNWKQDWMEAGQIRVAEYWEKIPRKRELLQLSDGEVVYADELGKKYGVEEKEELSKLVPPLTVLKTRDVDSHKVQMRMTNGREWLGETYEFKSKFIPVIPCWGNIQNVDGQDYWSGAVRYAKDQQKLHNVHRTAVVEAVAKAPKAPFILRPKTIEGYEAYWKQANAEDFPYLPIRDDTPPGAEPKRSEQAQVPQALIELAQMDNDDIKAATGLFDPSLGQKSNETSGTAINARKMQGNVATFQYIDGLTYAIRYSYEILIDAIPNYYDTPRVVRILGEDGGEKWKHLYQTVTDPETGQQHTVNDIGKGKYDVVVTVGPAYATQRMEAVDAFTQLAGQTRGQDPLVTKMLTYQVFKNLDMPGSEEIAKALRNELVAAGALPPAPGDQPPKPPPPNPLLMAKVNEIGARIGKLHAETDATNAETQMSGSEMAATIRQLLSQAILNESKAMIQSGELDSMIRYNAQQFGPGGGGVNTPDNPHYVPPPDPLQQAAQVQQLQQGQQQMQQQASPEAAQ
jgi:Phage P22-like portal protein